jgi:N-acyl-D-amino-acid deacylase
VYDLIIKNATIIDGTKAPRYQADVAINRDRITQIGGLADAEAKQIIDARGKILAPGFIDVHNHSDAWLLKTPHLVAKTIQGFTTEVIMADGISYAPVSPATAQEWIFYLECLDALRFEEYSGWQTIGEYMALLDRKNVQNVMTHVPYANLRALALGFGRQAPDDYQMRQIKAEVQRGMDEGAVGLSTGLDYISECFATTDELVEACKPMSAVGGLYVTHVRYKTGTLRGIMEAVEIGSRADVPVHISHMKGESAQENETIIRYIDEVAVNEVDFSFDVYPYNSSSTMLNYLLPYEVWEDGPFGVMRKLRDPSIRARFAHSLASTPLDKIHIAWVPGKATTAYQGLRLSEYVEQVGRPAADALCDLLLEERLAVLLVFHRDNDDLVDSFLAHSRFMMGTDGIYFPDSAVHPRVYGSAARLLGPCVRDKKLFSLEEAVYKLSSYPAERFGVVKRGVIREGNYADLVIFDADAVVDHATFDDPQHYSAGVEHVIVNGVPIIREGQAVDDLPAELPGRYLKYRVEG